MYLLEYRRTNARKKARGSRHVKGSDVVTNYSADNVPNNDLPKSNNLLCDINGGDIEQSQLSISQGNDTARDNGFSQLSLSQSSVASIGRKNLAPLSISQSMSDISSLPAPRKRSRACVLCYGKGNGKNKCPKLIVYGAMPLARNDVNVRKDLAMNIMDINHFKTFTRDEFDERQVMKNFPNIRLPALIIHKKILIEENLVEKKMASNLCLECTFLMEGGEEDIRFTKVLFKAQDVAGYIQKTVSNTIVSLLHLL